MKADSTKYFVCPTCQGELVVESNEVEEGEILEGSLCCAGCAASYPILRGVPRFVSAESYADTFGRQWNRWSDTQHDSVNQTGIFNERFRRWTGWQLADLAGKVVVDCGCGPGGYIDVVKRCAGIVVGFDLSSAIDAAYRQHGRDPNVYLAQGDIFNPPLRRRLADRLFTFGVVQHTPDPERAYRSLLPLVKAGGQIAVWVYRRAAIPQPTFWLRCFTAGMAEPRATRFIEWYTPKAMAVSGLLGQVPGAGRYLRRLVPVADYRDRLPLSESQFREWALMDTHDMLITRFTYPQRWKDMQRWTRDLVDLRRPSPREMAAVATVPGSVASAPSRGPRESADSGPHPS